MHRLLALVALLSACAAAPEGPSADPNAGLLRDFLDGKYDGAGHPLNAKTVAAAAACGGQELRSPCMLALPEGATSGNLTINARLRVRTAPSHGTVVTVAVKDAAGTVVKSEKLTVARLRKRGTWIDLPVAVNGDAASVVVTAASGATVDLDYVEVFPTTFGLVASPGSGVIADTDRLTFELPPGRKLDQLLANGVDLTTTLSQLVSQHRATKTTTAFRTLYDVGVADLLPGRGEVTDLRLATSGAATRLELRKAPAPCAYAGDATATTKVLITGFQPFPADGWHDNVSGVAVTAMNPANIRGAQVMKLVLPVEYDRAAAEVVDAIARCAPDVVISFGQGGGDIALEEVAYNLQDTGEIAGGVPDNRGVVRAAQPIDEAAPAERDTLLPIDAIEQAIVDLGEAPQHSRDPGRYICNNVMFADIGAMAGHGRAGFIHLPYTSSFDDAVRARFAKVVEAAVQASVE